jgi:hypothetical protein
MQPRRICAAHAQNEIAKNLSYMGCGSKGANGEVLKTLLGSTQGSAGSALRGMF